MPHIATPSLRRFRTLLLLAGWLWLCCGFAPSAGAADDQGKSLSHDTPSIAELELFVREGCPHCAEAERFVARLRQERPGLRIVVRDIRKDPAALARLRELALNSGAAGQGVPSFHLRGELVVGFAGEVTTGAYVKALLDRRPAAPAHAGSPGDTCALDQALSCKADPAVVPESIALPWLGLEVSVDDLGLPAFTMVMGLLDGLNPCSMWVLVMMISMLAAIGERKKMLAIAGTFVAVEGIAYFAFMAAWLNLFLLIGISRMSEMLLGLIACIAGLINLKDFLALGRGISLSIPAAAKPRIYTRMRRVLHEESMPVAILGTVVLAVLVQLVELLCTSGFPMLYTRILTLRNFDRWTYYGYLLLYNAMYMLDDIIVLAIGVVTLSRHRLQEKEGRLLKLLSGCVLLLLGVYLMA